jgi:RHS repeat-associated protein
LENGLNGETADPLQESVDSLQRYYVWAPGGDLLYMIDAAEGNKVYFYHFDRTGSTLALTDGAGNVTDAYAYDPYGKLLAHTGGSSQPFTFVGQWGARQEGNSGELYHIRARYYDAVTARFISPDPIWPQIEDPQQLNPYTYANNSPLNYVDVNGTEPDSSNYEKVKVKWQGRLPVYFKAGEKLVVDGRSVQVASSSFPVKANINLAAYGNPSTSPPQVDPSRLAKVQRMEPTNPNVRGRFVQPQYRQTPWYSKFNLAAGKDLLFGGLVGLAVGIGWEAWAEVSGWNKVQELQAQGRDREIFNRNAARAYAEGMKVLKARWEAEKAAEAAKLKEEYKKWKKEQEEEAALNKRRAEREEEYYRKMRKWYKSRIVDNTRESPGKAWRWVPQ